MRRNLKRWSWIPILMLAGGLSLAGEPREGMHPHGAGDPGGFPDLVGGLKAIDGCLGVETARTGSGKQVIFAWFEDKAAALRWFYSDMHQGAMSTFFPGGSAGTPLAEVPDGTTVVRDGVRGDVRFDRIAGGYGAHGEFVDRTEDVGPAVERALASGRPAVVQVAVDPTVNAFHAPHVEEFATWYAGGYSAWGFGWIH